MKVFLICKKETDRFPNYLKDTKNCSVQGSIKQIYIAVFYELSDKKTFMIMFHISLKKYTELHSCLIHKRKKKEKKRKEKNFFFKLPFNWILNLFVISMHNLCKYQFQIKKRKTLKKMRFVFILFKFFFYL